MNELQRLNPEPQVTLLLTLNFKEDAMMLNDGILDVLERPKQVQILLNEESKMLALRSCDMDSRQAVLLPEERTLQVEIGGRSLLRRIKKMTGWKTDQPRVCIGSPVPEYRAVCFALEDAIVIDSQRRES
jgi:hypothetical protein